MRSRHGPRQRFTRATIAELIVNGGRYMRGYDPLIGKELWRFADNDTQVKMQAPLIAHDLIYITGGYPPGRVMYVFRPGAVGDIFAESRRRAPEGAS